MTYITGGIVEAVDYNTFSTLSTGINEVFADDHPGSVRNTIAYPTLTDDPVTFGYGQTALTPVSVGNPVLASEWSSLFDTIRKVGQHQNTTVVPPLPGISPGFPNGNPFGSTFLPVSGDIITAYAGVATLIDTLRDNRLLLSNDASQYTFIPSISGTPGTSGSPWLTLLTYTFQLNFGSWNNARYFFNSGGFVGINGSMPSPTTPIETAWANALALMSPLKFTYNGTTPNSGSGATSIGFYALTNSYQVIYTRPLGGSYYTSSYVEILAKLNAAPGTNGLVDFQIRLEDGDLTPDIKSASISFTVSETHSTGAVSFPGSVTGSSSGFTYT